MNKKLIEVVPLNNGPKYLYPGDQLKVSIENYGPYTFPVSTITEEITHIAIFTDGEKIIFKAF